jgi:hypothetical protein
MRARLQSVSSTVEQSSRVLLQRRELLSKSKRRVSELVSSASATPSWLVKADKYSRGAS